MGEEECAKLCQTLTELLRIISHLDNENDDAANLQTKRYSLVVAN